MDVILRGAKAGHVVKFDKRSHVELSDGVYEKTDTANVVRIDGRYFRKSSPLVTKLDSYYGNSAYDLTDNVVELVDGGFSKRRDAIAENVFEINVSDNNVSISRKIVYYPGYRAVSSDYTTIAVRFPNRGNGYSLDRLRVMRSNFQSLMSNEDVKKFTALGGGLCLASDAIELGKGDTSHYFPLLGKSVDTLISERQLLYYDGSYYSYHDLIWSQTPKGERYKPIFCSLTGDKLDDRERATFTAIDTAPLADLALKIVSRKISIEGGMHAFVTKNIKSNEIDVDFSSSSFHSKMGILCSSEDHMNALNNLHDFLLENHPKKCIDIQKAGWFMGMSNEAVPYLYGGFQVEDTGGDYVFIKGRKPGIELSPSLSKTGGIGYTFGVELETSYGLLPKTTCVQLGLDAVGDRSIGALEYVTEPLHGTLGMEKLETQVSVLSKYCGVDDRCGVHVHVGGAKGAETPFFNREFSVYSIMLGTQIEKELFSLLPDNRMEQRNSNGLSYCGSILDFASTNMKNGRMMLSRFVFGHDDGFSDEEFKENGNVPDNSRHELNRWAPTRYKWLNLINCNTNNSNRRNGGGFVTIEFRAFNGTLNPNDIKAFVLISLAFVKFVENNKRDISKGGVTIKQMLASTLKYSSMSFMEEWIDERTSIIKKVRKARKGATNSIPSQPVVEVRRVTPESLESSISRAEELLNEALRREIRSGS